MNKLKKVLKAIIFHLNPGKVSREFQKKIKTGKYIREGYLILPPNYLLKPNFKENEVAIDVGCGFEVELSRYLIDNFNLHCYCVDPTKKHEPYIKSKVEIYHGKLNYLQNALCSKNCTLTFNETIDNESGSIFNDHINILNDRINQYQVEGIDLTTLIAKTEAPEISLLKIDIEGAEYELFSNINDNDLLKCKQIFIEFHHISVKRYYRKDTLKVVNKIKSLGFEVHSLDGLNYLFIRK